MPISTTTATLSRPSAPPKSVVNKHASGATERKRATHEAQRLRGIIRGARHLHLFKSPGLNMFFFFWQPRSGTTTRILHMRLESRWSSLSAGNQASAALDGFVFTKLLFATLARCQDNALPTLERVKFPSYVLWPSSKMDEETKSPSVQPNKSFLEEVNFPEPGIINLDMIKSSYLEEGQHGEARRLHQLEPIILERIKTLRLEFKS